MPSHNDEFSEASDHLPKAKTSASASKQSRKRKRKRKRTGSAGENGEEYDDHQLILMIEHDLATDKQSRYLKSFEVREQRTDDSLQYQGYRSSRSAPSAVPYHPCDHESDTQMRDTETGSD